MESITSTVKEDYLYANATNDQCGIHLAVWLYLTYTMDPDQRKSLLTTQIGSLDITKYKNLLTFLSYVEKLGHTGRNLDNNDEANLQNAVAKEILRPNHTSITTVITTYRDLTTTSINGIVQAARMEYHSAISGTRWNWSELVQPLKVASNMVRDE